MQRLRHDRSSADAVITAAARRGAQRLTCVLAVAGLAVMLAAPAPDLVDKAAAQSLFDWDRERPQAERRRQEEERRLRSQRRADYCRKLEQRLVQEWRRTNDSRSELPKLRQELREAGKSFRTAQKNAEQRRCHEETFFFGRSLRRTPECVRLDQDVQRARREYKLVRERIDRISRSGSAQNRQDDLIAQLARYGCGEDYERQYEARRPTFFSFFDDRGSQYREPQRRGSPSDLPFATYRTMCVRRCDGYYFPVSFSTLPSQFSADEAQCVDRCAAPTELFVYRNPGEDVESMVSLNGKPYTELDNAWLYRKKFINGCSCDAKEYSEAEIAKSQAAAESAVEGGNAPDGSAPAADVPGDNKRAESDQAAEDLPLIRDAPKRDSFDPRQR